MKLINSNGDVELSLPGNASFQIDATARNGGVESEYAGLEPVKSSDGEVLKSKVKTGGPKISVETKYGTIQIHPHEGGDAN